MLPRLANFVYNVNKQKTDQERNFVYKIIVYKIHLLSLSQLNLFLSSSKEVTL